MVHNHRPQQVNNVLENTVLRKKHKQIFPVVALSSYLSSYITAATNNPQPLHLHPISTQERQKQPAAVVAEEGQEQNMKKERARHLEMVPRHNDAQDRSAKDEIVL